VTGSHIYALGFQTYSVRVLAHSVLGCVFYGAFVAKMLSLVRRETMPRWVLPVLGGVGFASLIALWATSALWLFATRGAHS
jgi:branched-subunit amino acid transport protein